MGILDYNLADIPELEVLPPDEYQLEVASANSDVVDKNNNPGLKLLLKSDKTNTALISHWIGLPHPENDDEEESNKKLRRLKRFVDAFSIVKHDTDEDLIGTRGFCLLALEESDEYGKQNRVKKFVVPA